ncbi:MAG TPA: 2,3-bisphosphoglycerate-independent phosphoglycerate mutase [Bacteroidia bacterium]|nr:2,3-bisphosphoglycerate-independent phosphoglycerate mutase [Bacteroidia bacterium]
MSKAALIILDGWGLGNGSKSDAVAHANVPFYQSLLKSYPHSQLLACGEDVGLPEGQMGNSEVGHLNIGAGRVVYQDLVKINLAIKDKSFFENIALVNAINYAKNNNQALHLMGLLSDGGVHSSNKHVYALCDMAKNLGHTKVYIHAFLDGRDTDPKSGLGFIQELEKYIRNTNSPAQIVSVCGRYYAMDRDKRWERVKIAYDLIIHAQGAAFANAEDAIAASYNEGVTDEFLKPCIINKKGIIKENDAVICFNFRTDRCREITEVLTQKDMPEYNMQTMPLHYTTMTRYDEQYKNVYVCYEKDNLSMTLGEVIANAKKTQLRAAETEKYPHVTFFFSGGREAAFDGEMRIMEPSPKVATYDLQPEMSAIPLKDKIVKTIHAVQPDFICLNFANPDMVGHTGVFSAVVKALETVDACLQDVVQAGLQHGYSFIIIADHGNADYMLNDDGSPNTAHSLNPVPCILISNEFTKIEHGRLADVAPCILKIMHLEQPVEMTGKVLVS